MIKEIIKIKQVFIKPKSGWTGDYKSWEEASQLCTNYSDRSILVKVRNALLEVKNGKAAFERDSVLFYQHDYNWPFLSGLLWAFGKSNGNLTVIDFGGSLGSIYFQHRVWLDGLAYTWNVIEQPHFVEEGKKYFQDETLRFFNTVDEIQIKNPSFLVLSGVLAYLPDPYAWLNKLLDKKFDYIFIDRTPLIRDKDRLTIQNVPKEIYNASYPAWFFNRDKFIQILNKHYHLRSEHVDTAKANFESEFMGFFLTLKK